jgi:hypothetical protein
MSETQGSSTNPDDWSTDDGGSDSGRTSREWLAQLQSMIDNAATAAAPILREVAAKAAELAAVAGEKAGPIAHKAADVTAEAGTKIAERGREVAAELRRDTDRDGGAGGEASSTETTAPLETLEPGSTPPSAEAPAPDTADRLGE